jgi:hypothetical protein
MIGNFQEELEKEINDLKEILSNVDTMNLLGTISNEFGVTMDPFANVFKKTSLSSPFKQYLYTIGLLLSTEEKKDKQKSDYLPMDEIKQKLNKIVDLYATMFFPKQDEEIDEQWYQARKISMPVFLNYFNTNSLTFEEQVISKIRDWYGPYSDLIKDKIGVSVDELLDIFTFIRENLQERLDRIAILSDRVKEDQKKFFKHMKENGVTFEQARKELYLPNTMKLGEEIQLIYHVEVEALERNFGEETIRSFIELFSLVREKRDFFYYTEENPFEISPIWRKNDQYLFVPIYKQIIHAIDLRLSNLLESSEVKTRYLKNRDMQTEERVTDLFKSFLGTQAKYYTSIFETNKSKNEHDLLIEFKNNLLIVEVKASKVKEPFRDPEKAYIRIKRDFRSESGIQKAYDQGLNLKNHILAKERTILYDDKGNEVVELKRDSIKKIYILIITAENMGILATNLSYLLEKPIEEPYPWSCNVHDLETALNGFNYKGLNGSDFLEYLHEREALHKKLFSSDELEILGYYLTVGKLMELSNSNSDLIAFQPEHSDIFDEIYFQEKGIVPNFNSSKRGKVKGKETKDKSKKRNKCKRERLSRRKNRKR